MSRTRWLQKPYYSLDAYCKETFGHKCYKVALNAHMSCPNRDGLLDTRGCIFCSKGGSGDFAVDTSTDMDTQLKRGLALFGDKTTGASYIAYFQAYTNTYGPLSYLREVFTKALSHPDICGISIATRPDCLPPEVLSLLKELKTAFPDKFIWVELGLQTIHERTAEYIRRGYKLEVFEQAVKDLKKLDIPVVVHVILGLPGETISMQLDTIHYLNRISPFGVKLQLLHVLKGTDLASEYEKGAISVLEKDEYLSLLIQCLEHLSPDIVIHRVTGDGPRELLLAPKWSTYKKDVLNSLHHQMKLKESFQGKYLEEMRKKNDTRSPYAL